MGIIIIAKNHHSMIDACTGVRHFPLMPAEHLATYPYNDDHNDDRSSPRVKVIILYL